MTPEEPRVAGLEGLAAGDLTTNEEKYREALRNMPRSGGGGCHVALLTVANLGRAAGHGCGEIAKDLRAHVRGSRRVPESEIRAAVQKAFKTTAPIAKPSQDFDSLAALERFLKRGAGATATELWEASPVRIDWPVERDAIELLSRLYAPDEHLFIGNRYETGAEHVRPASEWIQGFARGFARGLAVPEHIIPNPLSGLPAETKEGKPSYRADACVARFPIVVIEFDSMPKEQQIEFWAGQPMHLFALIDSGGKSVHGWVNTDAKNASEWESSIETNLFQLLIPMGVDRSCKNESRLSRMPGHFRAEKGRWQRLLYLNPKGDCAVKP